MRGAEIDSIAAWARKRFASETPHGRSLDIERILEDIDGYAIHVSGGGRIPIHFLVENTHEGIEGLVRFEKARGCIELVVSEATYQGIRGGHSRARFAAAHEIGHALLHAELVFELGSAALPGLMRTTSHPPYCDSEWQANRFAASFLAPPHAIRQLVSRGANASQISERFGISLACAEIAFAQALKEAS